MEADDLQDLLRECPLLVRMNDGREVLVEKPEFIVVSPYNAAVLVEEDERKRLSVISLINITSVVPNYDSPDRAGDRADSPNGRGDEPSSG